MFLSLHPNLKTMETIIKKRINHDSMWISAKFPSGANFKFTINRRGETLALAFSNDEKELKEQNVIFSNWLRFRPKENNAQRFDRIEELCKKCKSGKELINLIK